VERGGQPRANHRGLCAVQNRTKFSVFSVLKLLTIFITRAQLAINKRALYAGS
jgi:hypothetical protein